MPESLFISDLHLREERPHTIGLFTQFMETRAPQAETLYILGDLFEAWVGDDDRSETNCLVDSLIQNVVKQNTQVFFMHGNRDFLIASAFAERTGCKLLSDPTVVDLYGEKTLLMHGDSLCTDDVDHQKYRAQMYTDGAKQALLEKPLDERLALAAGARKQSETGKAKKTVSIMDVNEATVITEMERFGIHCLIHGHTHRPARHDYEIAGQAATRWVLPEWDEAGGALSVSIGNIEYETYS